MKEHGGYGALLNRPARLVDTDLLAADAAAEGKALVTALQAAAPAADAASRAPEAMTYSFTIDDDGDCRELRLSDAALGREGGALLDWFLRHAGK